MVRLDALSGWGVLCGLGIGLGLWSLVGLVPRLSRPRLANRVAPYLVDVSAGARELLARRSIEPIPVVGSLFAPLLDRLRAVLGRALGGTTIVELRLRQSASRLGPEAFRSQQLVWGMGGAALGIVAAVAVSRLQQVPFLILVAIVVIFACCGVVARDRLLVRSARSRVVRISAELPTVLEFLTLSLSAGEGVLDAIRRVSRVSHGELAKEFAGVVTSVSLGLPLADSLTTLATSLQLAPLTRCVDQIVGALERGTPLAEVLRAQAQDARDDAKTRLLETAGKKEVGMLIPLVFLILPVTVVFAIYPGIVVLQFGL
ncbi:MAG TPA: type II secretion system F family protein [Lacisediminihabitans sp.]|uniref:type II secretion system F family protein n=1 Tax=Lacisediminihabitans sp. TaxID=2787631 RepID=UPI002EDB3C22